MYLTCRFSTITIFPKNKKGGATPAYSRQRASSPAIMVAGFDN